MKLKLSSFDGASGSGAKGGDVELNDEVFGIEPRADILHRVVTWQLEKRRATARGTRERADVARTGKKFGRQKGGGYGASWRSPGAGVRRRRQGAWCSRP